MGMESGTVLVVDDDAEVRSAVRDVLVDHGFSVTEASTGQQGIDLAHAHPVDVVLLDLGLPDMGGLDVLLDMTKPGSAPVIVLSGRSGETDRVVGLDLGADDYIVKPFSARELVARVNAVLRRTRSDHESPTLAVGGLVLNEHTREVTVDATPVELTPKEFDLLAFLARSPRRVYTRSQLLQHVWKSSSDWQDDSTVAEHVHRIRRKLDPGHRDRWIETVHGVGYRFGPSA